MAAALLALAACGTTVGDLRTMDNTRAEGTLLPPPPPDKIPKDTMTRDYALMPYFGLDEHFNPDPWISYPDYKRVRQLDFGCTRQANKLVGRWKEAGKQGVLIGTLEGGLGALGALIGYGSVINPRAYGIALAGAGLGGGIANGLITFDLAGRVIHGYCMTLQIWMAQQNDGKLKRIGAIPAYAGESPLPEVRTVPDEAVRHVPAAAPRKQPRASHAPKPLVKNAPPQPAAREPEELDLGDAVYPPPPLP